LKTHNSPLIILFLALINNKDNKQLTILETQSLTGFNPSPVVYREKGGLSVFKGDSFSLLLRHA